MRIAIKSILFLIIVIALRLVLRCELMSFEDLVITCVALLFVQDLTGDLIKK